jgi:hypothetical protein
MGEEGHYPMASGSRIAQSQAFMVQGEQMAGKIKTYPKPKRTPAGQELMRKKRGLPTKLQPNGPPFRPRVNGDPEEKL